MKTPLLTTAFAALATVASAQDTTVTVFHAWPHHAEWQQGIADRFMEANPGIDIDILAPSVDYDEGLVSVIRQDMAGTAPDVFLVGSHLLGELVARDMVEPIDDLLEGRDMAAMGYSDAALALTQVDGVQYGLPWTSSTPVMFYNADLVRQAGGDPEAMPETWEETIALGKAIDDLGDDISGIYYPPGDDDWMVQNLLATSGMQPMASDGTIAFDTQEGREALRLYERFHDEAGQMAIPNSAARQMMYAGDLGL
ncbi:MAG: ABC transporter substrate-binding protein, partial [Shimia sp.]